MISKITHMEDLLEASCKLADKLGGGKISLPKAALKLETHKEIRKSAALARQAQLDSYLNHDVKFLKRKPKEQEGI